MRCDKKRSRPQLFKQHVGLDLPQMYPAGTYRVAVEGQYRMIHLSTPASREHKVALVTSVSSPSAAWREDDRAVLAFECGLGRCQLISVWGGAGRDVLSLPHARTRPGAGSTNWNCMP